MLDAEVAVIVGLAAEEHTQSLESGKGREMGSALLPPQGILPADPFDTSDSLSCVVLSHFFGGNLLQQLNLNFRQMNSILNISMSHTIIGT